MPQAGTTGQTLLSECTRSPIFPAIFTGKLYTRGIWDYEQQQMLSFDFIHNV